MNYTKNSLKVAFSKEFDINAKPLGMLDYGIPNDSLIQRIETFQTLMTPDAETRYMDGEVYQLLRPYVKEKELDQEGRLWLAIVYSLSYSCSTAIRFMEEFPTINDIVGSAIDQFWVENKPTLWFNPDRRYLKNNNQAIPALRCIYELSHGNLCDYLIPKLKAGFDVMYKEIIDNWKFYGPMAAYLFFDAIYAFSEDLYSDPSTLDWRGSGQTVVEGMAILLGDDKAIETKDYDIPKFNRMVDIIEEVTGFPKIVIESNLCFFRKLFKGSRYVGYYADRELEEYLTVHEILMDKYNIDIWNYREITTQDSLRGEIHGWNSIRKDKLKEYLLTGKIL